MIQHILRKISLLTSISFLVKPVWFVFITAICMRRLGTAEYGVMALALSLATLATAFTDWGTVKYVLREASRNMDNSLPLFTNFLVLRTVLSAVAFVVLLLAAIMLGYPEPVVTAVIFAAIYTLTLNITNYCRTFFQAYEKLNYEAVSLAVEKTLVISLGIAMLFITQTAWGTLLGMAAGMSIATIINILWVAGKLTGFDAGTLNLRFITETVKCMIPFGLAGLFTVAYLRTSVVIVEAILGETPTGQFGAAFRILEALSIVPAIVAVAAIYPRLSALFVQNRYQEFKLMLRNGLLLLGGISMAVSVVLTAGGPLLITMLDPNPDFQPAGRALQLLCWAFPFQCWAALLGLALMAMEQQKSIAIILGVAVPVSIFLHLMFIPQYGIFGAAVVMVIVEGLVFLALTWRVIACRHQIS